MAVVFYGHLLNAPNELNQTKICINQVELQNYIVHISKAIRNVI